MIKLAERYAGAALAICLHEWKQKLKKVTRS